jgi:hypothetical protein
VKVGAERQEFHPGLVQAHDQVDLLANVTSGGRLEVPVAGPNVVAGKSATLSEGSTRVHLRSRSYLQEEDHKLPKPNYQFEKRKRDMEKKAKKEEKKQRKLQQSNPSTPPPSVPPTETT